MIEIESQALSNVIGGKADNSAKAVVGLQYGGLTLGATVAENKTDYRSCLDSIAKYNGKVSECSNIHDKA